MSKIWPHFQNPRKLEPLKSKEEIEYEEYLITQKRFRAQARIHVEPVRHSRREFMYSEEAIENARRDRHKEIYSVKDMDDELTAKPPSTKDLWFNKDVEESTEFDVDAPIPKKELRPLTTRNEFKLQEELTFLSKKLVPHVEHDERGDEDFVFRPK
jgi:hypothetical protein